MKFLSSTFLTLFLTLTSAEANSECEKAQFQYKKDQQTISKNIFLCEVKSEIGSSFVSRNCLDNACPELNRFDKIKLKKYPYAVNKSRLVCEQLKGVFLDGLLTVKSKIEPRPFCFFQTGSIISSDYLYSKKKSLIAYE